MGSVIALIFIEPNTIKGFIRRLVASLLFGIAISPLLRDFAGFPDTWKGALGAACLTSIAAWGAVGIITDLMRGRAIRKWVERKLGLSDEPAED